MDAYLSHVTLAVYRIRSAIVKGCFLLISSMTNHLLEASGQISGVSIVQHHFMICANKVHQRYGAES